MGLLIHVLERKRPMMVWSFFSNSRDTFTFEAESMTLQNNSNQTFAVSYDERSQLLTLSNRNLGLKADSTYFVYWAKILAQGLALFIIYDDAVIIVVTYVTTYQGFLWNWKKTALHARYLKETLKTIRFPKYSAQDEQVRNTGIAHRVKGPGFLELQ